MTQNTIMQPAVVNYQEEREYAPRNRKGILLGD
jgi:hypothetical protein